MANLKAIMKMYEESPQARTFPEDLCLLLTHGYGIVTPTSILLGIPIHHESTQEEIEQISFPFLEPDTWFVWLAHGATPLTFLQQAPYPLKYIAWSKRGEIRIYESSRLQSKLKAFLS